MPQMKQKQPYCSIKCLGLEGLAIETPELSPRTKRPCSALEGPLQRLAVLLLQSSHVSC